jgi:hypothetical protein
VPFVRGTTFCQKDKAARSIDTAASLQLLLLLPCHPSPFFSSNNRCTRFFFNASSSSDNNLRHSSTVSFELHIGYIIASIESAGFVVLLLFSRIGNFRSSNNSGMLLFAAGFLLRRRAFLFFPPILSKCPKMPLSLIWKKKKKKRVPIALQHLQ